jgi:ubiquinone/menaquinone biosynthesis C-methylase UbiE
VSFDVIAEKYDQWYDSAEGVAIFNAELKCLQSINTRPEGRWIEAGVGTGRFASAMGIPEGIDPSLQMLAIARKRGIRATAGSAEHLPFPDNTFDGILMVVTLCFINDAPNALSECRRILLPSGKFLLGIVPADSPWGKAYIEKARDGHSIYSHARFRTSAEILNLITASGFNLSEAASTLFWFPSQISTGEAEVKPGIIQGAGFIGLLFEKF